MIALRSFVYFGLVTFIPLYFIHVLGTGKALGNAALSAMLVGGAFGTLIGGPLADRFGRRSVTIGLSIGLGGVGAPLLGILADADGLRSVFEVIAVLPLAALVLSLLLPGRLDQPAFVARRIAGNRGKAA